MSNNQFPDYKKFLNPETILRLSSLEIRAKYIVEGFLLGLHKSPYHGFSIEFSQHRAYMQGDSLRDVDWKVYGKTDKYFVKQYEEETNLRCNILLDISGSMQYSQGNAVKKVEYGSTLAAAMAYMMIKQKDAAGLMLYSDKIHKYLPPRATEIYLKEILLTLSHLPEAVITNTSVSLKSAAEKIHRRGMIIIISDLFDDPAATIKSLKELRSTGNEVVVFHILDEYERNFNFASDSLFRDLETGEELSVQPHHLRKSYRQAIDEFITELRNGCRKSGIDYNLMTTSHSFDKALYTYLQKRALMK